MKGPKDIAKKIEGQMPGEDYLSKVKLLLRKGKEEEALLILRHAAKEIPDDLFILSYYGCLMAVVERKASSGAKICSNAISLAKRSRNFGGFIHPLFYLNLGRCYYAGGQRKKAIDTFMEGLRVDPNDNDIRQELKRIGIRKKSLIPFLPRNNPLNKYIGLLISRMRY